VRIFIHYIIFKRLNLSWSLVAHACNPSYSGGRDQENSGGVAQGVGPEFKLQYCKNKQKDLISAIQEKR
jgi:hypothetical protein